MASMGGVMNAFSTQTSMAAAPINRDRTAVNTGKRDAYTVTERRSRFVGFRSRGIVLQVDPSPRLRLGTFNGRRPTRESLIGNGGGAPPVSRFLYRPALWANKKRKSREILLGSVSDYATYQELLTRCGDIPIGVEPVPFFSQLFIRQSMGQRSGLDYAQPSITLKPNNYLCPRVSSK